MEAGGVRGVRRRGRQIRIVVVARETNLEAGAARIAGRRAEAIEVADRIGEEREPTTRFPRVKTTEALVLSAARHAVGRARPVEAQRGGGLSARSCP